MESPYRLALLLSLLYIYWFVTNNIYREHEGSKFVICAEIAATIEFIDETNNNKQQ